MAVVPLETALSGEALESYNTGRLLFYDGDKAGALVKFRHAYDLSPEPGLLWNMAVCEKELRHYAAATALIDRYVSEGDARVAPESLETARQTRIALKALYSTLTLEGAPAGARVLVDGAEVGKTPLAEPLSLDLGKRTVSVEASGFEPFSRTLDVPGNTDMKLAVELRAEVREARLSILASAGETVRVDGKVVGTARWEGLLAPGKHTISVTGEGKKPYLSDILLAPRSHRALQITLEKEDRGALWPWLLGGAAVLGGAAAGGYFLFRDNTEPGDAPRGDLGTVYLK